MAVDRKKYPLPNKTKDDEGPLVSDIKFAGPAKVVKDKAPVIHSDGTVVVENLQERSSSELSFASTPKVDSFYFNKKLDENTEVQLIPKNIDKVYKTTISYKGEVKEAFAVFKSDVKRLITKDLDRYKTAPKPLKKKIDALQKDKNEFIFTDDINGIPYNRPYRDSTSFGPYNYDVHLEVTKDIEFINDLIVIRSGEYVSKYDKSAGKEVNLPNTWSIAWVSPHHVYNYSGLGNYVLSGTESISTFTGVGGYSGLGMYKTLYHLNNNWASFGLSSKDVFIPAGQKLFSGLSYLNIGAEGDPTALELENPLYEDFYYNYVKYQSNFNSGGWDGVIPSGVWFNIETWSTNPRYIGFDGEITVKPTGVNDPTCTYSGETKGWATSKNYQESVRKAVKEAKKRFHKNLNKVLVSKGIKKTNRRIARYNNLLERVAQNVYDGLSMVRNEQISKVQGTEKNPLDSPVYYDGTSKVYDGSNESSLYDHGKTTLLRTKTGSSTSSGGTSSSSSSSSGY
ncbi:hypothetical protein CL634_03825 [bacterium]|nr:hypothetical protein [bacterium]